MNSGGKGRRGPLSISFLLWFAFLTNFTDGTNAFARRFSGPHGWIDYEDFWSNNDDEENLEIPIFRFENHPLWAGMDDLLSNDDFGFIQYPRHKTIQHQRCNRAEPTRFDRPEIPLTASFIDRPHSKGNRRCTSVRPTSHRQDGDGLTHCFVGQDQNSFENTYSKEKERANEIKRLQEEHRKLKETEQEMEMLKQKRLQLREALRQQRREEETAERLRSVSEAKGTGREEERLRNTIEDESRRQTTRNQEKERLERARQGEMRRRREGLRRQEETQRMAELRRQEWLRGHDDSRWRAVGDQERSPGMDTRRVEVREGGFGGNQRVPRQHDGPINHDGISQAFNQDMHFHDRVDDNKIRRQVQQERNTRSVDDAEHDSYQVHFEPKKGRELLTLDISKGYFPDEIKINTVGHKLFIRGTQFCKCEDGCLYKEFERPLDIPTNTETGSLTATLDSSGKLRLHGNQFNQLIDPKDTAIPVHGLGIPQSSGRTPCAQSGKGFRSKAKKSSVENRRRAHEYDEVTGTYIPVDDYDDDGVTVEVEN